MITTPACAQVDRGFALVESALQEVAPIHAASGNLALKGCDGSSAFGAWFEEFFGRRILEFPNARCQPACLVQVPLRGQGL